MSPENFNISLEFVTVSLVDPSNTSNITLLLFIYVTHLLISHRYVYADVCIFLNNENPSLDMTLHHADVDLSEYEFLDFVDTIQVSETSLY